MGPKPPNRTTRSGGCGESSPRPPRGALRRAALGARDGLSALGTTALVVVVSVVVTVSIPRLRSFAADENEAEARSIALMLAREIPEFLPEHLAREPEPEAPVPRIESLTHRRMVQRALSDSELLEEGRLLRRHGYLFCLVRIHAKDTPIVPESPSSLFSAPRVQAAGSAPTLGVIAWPWQRGRTGSYAVLATPDGAVYQHRNDAGLWNGPSTAPSDGPLPVLASWKGWRVLPR